MHLKSLTSNSRRTLPAPSFLRHRAKIRFLIQAICLMQISHGKQDRALLRNSLTFYNRALHDSVFRESPVIALQGFTRLLRLLPLGFKKTCVLSLMQSVSCTTDFSSGTLLTRTKWSPNAGAGQSKPGRELLSACHYCHIPISYARKIRLRQDMTVLNTVSMIYEDLTKYQNPDSSREGEDQVTPNTGVKAGYFDTGSYLNASGRSP